MEMLINLPEYLSEQKTDFRQKNAAIGRFHFG